jgi:serine/threonine protein kinase
VPEPNCLVGPDVVGFGPVHSRAEPSVRVCPECDRQGIEEICSACGTRTLLEAPSDPGIDPLLGRVFEGRYRIESLLGRGGMGAVYLATQITMNKMVAVKVVKPEFSVNTEAAKRFHREAKAASSLSHPHTIRVFDFGQTPQRELFMAMEFLDGRSLGWVLREGGRLPLQRTLKIVGEIASSLVEAHERGLVHRDLKPENVILLKLANDADFVKVLDFGIAKFLTGSSGDSTVTRTGAVIGTPQYMAPEQARASRGLSTAADVYSLGVMLYEMLTGALPFSGDSPIDMLMAHVTEPVPELPIDVEVPDDVRVLVGRMLAKHPGERPSSADVSHELEEIRDREKALSFMARRGTQERAAATLPEPSVTSRSASYAREVGSDDTALVEVATPAATPSIVTSPESLEWDLPRRFGGKAFWLVGGLLMVFAAIGLAIWLARGEAVEPLVETPAAQGQAPAPSAEAKLASPKAAGPSLSADAPVAAPNTAVKGPAPLTPAPIETAKPPKTVVAPTQPAVVPPASVSVPTTATPKPAESKAKPAAVKAKPAVVKVKPKRAAPRPAASKPAVVAPKKKPSGRTPAVW